MPMSTKFDLPWILPYVRESLRGRSYLSFDQFVNGVWNLLERAGVGKGIEKPSVHQGYTGRIYNYDAADHDIRNAATEAFYYLEQNRFTLRPPPTNSTAFLPHGSFMVTTRGQEWAKGAEPLPEDYDGYMNQFDPAVDPVVRQYVSESLNTYIRGTYFASAVMIGAASEKSIYLLADSLLPALRDPANQKLLQSRLDGRRLEQLLKFVEQTIVDGHTNRVIPFDVMGGTTRHLMSIFDSIRLQRNNAIHPMNFVVSADTVRFMLNAFPLAFKKVEALRVWCGTHPASL